MTASLLDRQNIETTDCRYGTMSYLKSDLIIGQALREYGEWAQGELNFLLDLIDVGDTVIDAGAFIGTHTLAFARHVGPGGQVYAFEPHPITFELLKLNIEQNELPNVKPFNVALSDTKGTLHIPEAVLNDVDNPEQFSLPIGSEVASTDTDSVDIELAPLDQYKMDRCDLIKIDVEGMELNVLKGSAKTLRHFRPLVFAECLSLHNGWQIVLFMRDNGFEAFLHNELSYNPDNFKKNANNFPGAARETNIVFVPVNRLSAFRERCKHFGSLIPLKTLDDLALGMLKKPQYKEELALTRAAQILGIDFLANEPELRQLADTASRVPPLEASLQEKVAQIHSLESQIQLIQHSIPMQLVSRYQRVIERLLRRGTRRRHYYKLVLTGIRVILNEGWGRFFTKAWFWLRIWFRLRIWSPFDAQYTRTYGDILLHDPLIEVIRSKAKRKSVIYDIGAFSGAYSIYLAHKVKQSRVYSFEPTPQAFNELIKNIEASGAKNITAMNVAISDHIGRQPFYVSSDAARSSFYSSNAAWDNREIIQSIEVDCVTIDHLVESGKILPPDILKIDVEGHEYEVVKGAEKTIRRFMPMIFYEPHGTPEVASSEIGTSSLLSKYGYEFTSLGYPIWCHRKRVNMQSKQTRR